MSALLLLSSLAFGDPPEPTYQRLFTPAETATAPALAAMPESSSLPTGGWAWPALLSGAGLVAAWQLRKRAGAAAPAELRVVQRQGLGDKSALVLVEVRDASGATRRLLVGSSGAGLNLLNDLGVVAPEAPAAVDLPSHDEEEDSSASTDNAPKLSAFHDLLAEVLTERGAEASEPPMPTIEELPKPRFFSVDDLAPVDSTSEVEDDAPVAPRAARRRGTLRGRFTARTPEATPTEGWSPTVESYVAADSAEPAPVEPRVEPVLRGGAALLARPVATTGTPKSGLSLLVKGKLPAAPTPAATTPTIAPPMMVEPAPEAPALSILPRFEEPAAPEAPPVAETPAPTRAVYVSPTMSTTPAPRAEKRLVGPPLRDPRLTAGAPVTPRLRLADSRSRPADEVVPPVGELIARLKEAQDAEDAEAIAANGQAPTARAEGIKRRFQALTVKEGGR